MSQNELLYEILAKIYNILLELVRNSTNYSEFLSSRVEELGDMTEQFGKEVEKGEE